MHELAITRGVVDLVVERTAGRRITRVAIRVGRLSGVVPDAMRFCFDVAAHGTPVQGAELVIEETPGRASCHACGQTFEVEDRFVLCECGSIDCELTGGEELLVTSVDLHREPSCA